MNEVFFQVLKAIWTITFISLVVSILVYWFIKYIVNEDEDA